MHDEMQPQNPEMNNLPNGHVDHEGAMAKADLYKLANYSLKLFKQIQDGDQMESWVQAKITKAADYIASVYHYLEYEMKFSEYGAKLENSEVYSESQKAEFKNKLMEARSAIKQLKLSQAEKQFGKVEEGIISGGEQPCAECGGSGVVMVPEKAIPEELKGKVKAYNRKAKAMAAAVKRIDANKNGIPDELENDEEVDEDRTETTKTQHGSQTATYGDDGKRKGVVHKDEREYSDEPHAEVPSKAKSKSAAEKKAEKEKEIKLPKHPKDKTWGMKGGEKFGQKEESVEEMYGQGIYEGSKPDYIDLDKDGNKKETMKKAAKDAKVKEELKGNQKKLDVDKDGDIEGDDLADLRAGKKAKEEKVDESKPSAGMTKKEKSAVVKKAKAGGDIGKPGKGFKKVAAAAKKGGAKDPEAVAAAAMWKQQAKESIKESLDRELAEGNMSEKEFMDRLNHIRATNPQALQAALNSTDPMALNKLIGFKLSPGEKLQPAVGDDDQGTLAMPKSVAKPAPAVVRESADLDRLKEFLTRLNG